MPGPASQRSGRFIGVMGDEPRAEILLETGHGDIDVRVAGAPLQAPTTTEWMRAVAECQMSGASVPPLTGQTGSPSLLMM